MNEIQQEPVAWRYRQDHWHPEFFKLSCQKPGLPYDVVEPLYTQSNGKEVGDE